MHWEDRFTSIIKLSDIKHPRKPLKSYSEGEYVTALFQKKPYKARISEISGKFMDPAHKRDIRYLVGNSTTIWLFYSVETV